MFESVHAVDVFFVIMTLSVAVATIIGSLIGWHIFGIARDAHKIVRTVQQGSGEVIHEIAVVTKEVVVEQKAAEFREHILADVRIKKPLRKSVKKPVTG